MLSNGLTFSFTKTIPHLEIQICVLYVSKESFLGHSNKLKDIFWFWNRLILLKMPTQLFLISNMEDIKLFFFLRYCNFTTSSFSCIFTSVTSTSLYLDYQWLLKQIHKAAKLKKGQIPHLACQGNSFYCKGYSEFSTHGINTAYFIMHPAFQTAAPQPSHD